jgi:hypothetical protein
MGKPITGHGGRPCPERAESILGQSEARHGAFWYFDQQRSMRPTPEQKRAAIRHIVYEYANLVSTGTRLLQTGADALKPPDNTHVQDAFLLNCRKMADFFKVQRRGQDVNVYDYVKRNSVTFTLSEWIKWSDAGDKHGVHITYNRLGNVTPWDGTANRPLLDEFRRCWHDFYSVVAHAAFKAEFDQQIEAKLACEGYGELDLK